MVVQYSKTTEVCMASQHNNTPGLHIQICKLRLHLLLGPKGEMTGRSNNQSPMILALSYGGMIELVHVLSPSPQAHGPPQGRFLR